MADRARSVAIAVVLTSIVGAVALPARPASPAPDTIGSDKVGGLTISARLTYAQVARYFNTAGVPAFTLSFESWGCRAYSPRAGLGIDFYELGISRERNKPTAADCTSLAGVSVTTPRWRTPKGLHVGAPIEILRRSYPRAFDGGMHKPPAGVRYWCAQWQLDVPRVPGWGLVACTAHRRVVSLGIEFFGH